MHLDALLPSCPALVSACLPLRRRFCRLPPFLSNAPSAACFTCSPPCLACLLVQVKTIWSVLLRNFEFELVDPFPEPNYNAMVIMPNKCRVRFTRRKL